MRKTKPIWPGGAGRPSPAPRPSGLAPARPIMRHRLDAPLRATNPNLGELGYLGSMTAGTDEGQMRQTNPILATARRRASGLRERSYDQSDLQRALEKQSQFGRSFKRKVSSVKSGKPGAKSRESSYFKLYASHFKLGRRPFVRNEANFGRCGHRAPIIPIFHHSNPLPMVRNKANWAGANHAKQTQFLPFCRSGDRRSREGNRAKRSQFAIFRPTRWTRQPPPYAGRTPMCRHLFCRLIGLERCAEKKPASLLAGGRARRTLDARPPWCVA